ISEFFHPRTLPGPILRTILTILATFLSTLSPFHQKPHFLHHFEQKIRCILTHFLSDFSTVFLLAPYFTVHFDDFRLLAPYFDPFLTFFDLFDPFLTCTPPSPPPPPSPPHFLPTPPPPSPTLLLSLSSLL